MKVVTTMFKMHFVDYMDIMLLSITVNLIVYNVQIRKFVQFGIVKSKQNFEQKKHVIIINIITNKNKSV